ncbi:MAG TPA: Rpn family recombination-promoting nuclease/putative transposase, partial [Spirochaetota bacterium]|nr:Rpn family recombination-promoting nuclease/putative transposase [Spirochaetota bacterium]
MQNAWLTENPWWGGRYGGLLVAQPLLEYTGNDEVEVRVTNDMVFRYLFGRPGSERILKSLINAVRVDAGLEPVAEVEVVDSATPEEFLDGKFSSVDVRARDTVGRLINIEMQTWRQPGFVERSLYAWARAYSAQVVSGQNWKSLSPVACINILD